jgi:hypothetical protein
MIKPKFSIQLFRKIKFFSSKLGTSSYSKMDSNSPIYVQCFGDSLTEGYLSYYSETFEPYTNKLSELLKKNFPEKNFILDN